MTASSRITPLTRLSILIAALVGVAILDGLLRVSRSVLLAWRGVKFEYQQSTKALAHLLKVDMVSFESQSKGAYLDKIQALEQVREFYYGQTILMLVDLPFVFVFLWLIWLFAGQMVLIPLTVIGIFLVVSLVTAHHLRLALEARSQSDERRQNFLIESLLGIHTLKSMAMESQMQRRYERLQAQSADAVYVLARVNSITQDWGSHSPKRSWSAFSESARCSPSKAPSPLGLWRPAPCWPAGFCNRRSRRWGCGPICNQCGWPEPSSRTCSPCPARQ